MDLATLDTTATADAGVPMELAHPKTGDVLRSAPPEGAEPGAEGAPITITLAGQDSARYRKARQGQITKRLGRRTPGKITGEDAENEALDVLVACTVSWQGIELQGQELPCNPGNVRRLFTALPWVREQADAFIHERANFLGNS